MGEIRTKALIENIKIITDCIEQELIAANCPMEAIIQMEVAIDEIVGNIAFYAYEDETGDLLVEYDIDPINCKATISFIDWGKPYDPLQKEDPDVTLSLEEREIGGLGIYIVKKTMDQVSYSYEKVSNKLSITKNW